MSQMKFERVEQEFYPERVGFRPRIPMFPMRMNFVFLNGGGGDYINWMRAIQWLATDATWIRGTLIHPIYFKELADYWLKPFVHWSSKSYNEIKDIAKADDIPFRGPMILQQESLNATGAHLSTCGWVYFTNKECAPEGTCRDGFSWDSYPRIAQAHLDALELPDAAKALEPGKYAVITTGVTTETRRVQPESWNHVIEYVRERGLTPVFLGKTVVETGNHANIHTEYGKELRLDLGVNLVNQTSLMQAAAIMSRARVVIGHDNGLLHLAGCTDVPIVFGYNLASPKHREPKRPHLPGHGMYNVHLTSEDLACNFCQSRTNFVIGFNFRQCFYGDYLCLSKLFEDGARRWKAQIDRALEENK